MSRALERLLRSAGMDCKTFASAEELLDDWRSRKPACCLVDIQLPRMSGLDLMRRLITEGSRAPMILITAHRGQGFGREAAEAGVPLLYKPFDDKTLIEAINKALGERAEVDPGSSSGTADDPKEESA